MRKQERILVVTLILLILPILAPGMITPAYAEQSPDVLVRQSEENEVDTNGDFAIALKDEPVPLVSGAASGGWALFNLIFTIIGIVTAIIISIHVLVKKQRALTDKNVKSGSIKPLQFLLAPFFAIAGITLFMLTQDVRTTMIIADGLTIAHATIFLCTILSSVMVYRNEKYGDDELQRDF